MVGLDVTVTVAVAVPMPLQLPLLTVQVAVYVVVEEGLTVFVAPVVPSFQLILPVQLETVNIAELPAQILGLLTLGVGVVAVVTVTVPVAVPLQLPTLHVAV